MSDLGNLKIMSENIQHQLDKKKINSVKLSDDLGINYTTIRNWLQGRSYPRIDKIEMMANYFGIDKSDLIERSNQETNKQGHNPIDLQDIVSDHVRYEDVNWNEWLSFGGKPLTEKDKMLLFATFYNRDVE